MTRSAPHASGKLRLGAVTLKSLSAPARCRQAAVATAAMDASETTRLQGTPDECSSRQRRSEGRLTARASLSTPYKVQGAGSDDPATMSGMVGGPGPPPDELEVLTDDILGQ